MTKAGDIVSKLLNGELEVNNLEWEELEDITELIVSRAFSDQLIKYQVERNHQGPIDIVITHEYEIPMVGKTQGLIFIECKNSSSNLGLNVIAKAMVVSIFERPTALIIVSPRPLQPQALEYCTKLFVTNPDVKGTTGVVFKSLLTQDLIERNFDIKSTAYEVDRYDRLEIESFKIIERDLYNDVTIYNSLLSTSANDPIIVFDRNKGYQFVIYFSFPPVKEYDKLTMTNESEEVIGSIESMPSLQSVTVDLKNPISFSQLHIKLKAKSGNTKKFTYPIKGNIGQTRKVNLEFRKAEIQGILETENIENAKVILISGEGGLGKSFLSNKITEHRKKQLNTRAILLEVSTNTGLNILKTLIFQLVSFNSFSEERDFSHELLIGSLDILLGQNSLISAESFYENLMNIERVSANDLADIALVIARIISSIPIRTLIVFRDAHKLSQTLLITLDQIMSNLFTFGWNKSQLLFEFRQNESKVPEFEAFVDEITDSYKSDVHNITLRPLDVHQIQDSVDQLFAIEDNQVLATEIFKKTGGNLLFIEQLVYYLLDIGVISNLEYEGSQSFVVADYPRLFEEIEILPKTVEGFLESRIKRYVSNHKEGNVIAAILSISSIIGFEINSEKLTEGLEFETVRLKYFISQLIADGFLRNNLNGFSVTFTHEFMQSSVKLCLLGESFRSAAFKLLAKLNYQDIKDLIICGDLNWHLHLLRDSYDCYAEGYAIAKRDGLYAFKKLFNKRLSLACSKLWTTSEVQNYESFVRWHEINMEAGWVEYQSGSLENAIKIFEEEISRIEGFQGFNSKSEKHHAMIETTHLLLAAYIDLVRPQEATSLLLKEIGMCTDFRSLLFAANRFILLCYRINAIETGNQVCEKLAPYFLNLKSLSKASSYDQMEAVFCSDIGHFILLDAPNRAIDLFQKAISIQLKGKISERQKIHGQIDKLIGDYYSNSYDIGSIVKKETEKQALEIQKVRVLLLEGIKAHHNGELTKANERYKLSLTKARFANLKVQEWQAHNNYAICLLEKKHLKESRTHFMRALLILKPVFEFQDYAVLNECLKLFKNQFDLLKSKDLKSKDSIELPHINFSGVHLCLLHNIDSFNRILGVDRIPFKYEEFYNLSRLPYIEVLGEKFLLTID